MTFTQTAHVDLRSYLSRPVKVACTDGRLLVGLLQGFDPALNLLLTHAHERVFTGEGVRVVEMGACVVRGEVVAVVGEFEKQVDEAFDYGRAAGVPPLLPIHHH
jgi:U6 snRNA-associated Sm-like protein LSm8